MEAHESLIGLGHLISVARGYGWTSRTVGHCFATSTESTGKYCKCSYACSRNWHDHRSVQESVRSLGSVRVHWMMRTSPRCFSERKCGISASFMNVAIKISCKLEFCVVKSPFDLFCTSPAYEDRREKGDEPCSPDCHNFKSRSITYGHGVNQATSFMQRGRAEPVQLSDYLGKI